MALQSIDIIINRLLPDFTRGHSRLAVFYVPDVVPDKDGESRYEVMFVETVAFAAWKKNRPERFIGIFSQQDKPYDIREIIESWKPTATN